MSGPTVQTLLIDLARIKALEEQVAKEKEDIQDRLVTALVQKGQKTISTSLDNGEVVKGTLVAPQRVVYDEERLKKTVGATKWEKITKRVLDKDKLEAAVSMGVVDANVAASCATVKDVKPHIKVTGDYSATALADAGPVEVTDSEGAVKPAARKRVRRPKVPA